MYTLKEAVNEYIKLYCENYDMEIYEIYDDDMHDEFTKDFKETIAEWFLEDAWFYSHDIIDSMEADEDEDEL